MSRKPKKDKIPFNIECTFACSLSRSENAVRAVIKNKKGSNINSAIKLNVYIPTKN